MNILCAGAAQGLVKALQGVFLELTGAKVEGRFGAVGAMKEALLAGEPCDVMIVTEAMISSLQADGRLAPGSEAALGRVRTGIAVRAGDAVPAMASPDDLKAALLAASSIYLPDMQRSTAGIHCSAVLVELGIAEAVSSRLRTFPNGATAMRELAADRHPGAIGCTQVTEIRYTPGVALVGALPEAFELATVYAAAVSAATRQPDLARRFVELIAGPRSRCLREQGGFEFTASMPSGGRLPG
ncbi:substrate-binding domain-containing protein [Variovorax sp. J22P240]|uniref:molybdate ABC transporter substrate-binding protein n=1 Tax=Variovorax sp. J22P240 TaxID=3053514 RepID=UPI002577AE89|nr:substrate-binding domain-containing protein [Variovorax sp. J22P240]MDL9998740.1 substrate-binding domain-containing protein [Variovorax sp. J22P240]